MSMQGGRDASRWQGVYNQIALCDVARHFAGIRQSPFMTKYLCEVLERCPLGGNTMETGIGTGYGAIWLSLRGVQAEGIDYAPGIVERARQVNNVLGGQAHFHVRDLFHLYAEDARRYHVIHHQGVLEHFTTVQIRAALAQQVALAEAVVFSVPSVYYPHEPEFGDERLLTLDVWREILALFDIEELRYYGDPQNGEQEHVLCVLRGQEVTEELLSMMTVPARPYPPGITVVVLARNEQRHIRPCLESAQSCGDQIIVIDMESEDDTANIARSLGAQVVSHPRIYPYDAARNLGVMLAIYSHVLVLDADERVTAELGAVLRELVLNHGDSFEGMYLPFRHYFAGHWMQCLYPGYTAPRLLKTGSFTFNPRLHSGVQVEGRLINYPADNPERALVHYSFDSMSHYLEKLNRYTDGEALSMHKDGQGFHWQNALRHFVTDFTGYYDRGRAGQDGVHGFIYSFFSAVYRFTQHAKLFEKRFHAGQLQPIEQAVPTSVSEILRFMLSVAEEKPPLQATEIRVDANAADAASVVWCGPGKDPSGTGEETRNFGFAIDGTGIRLAMQILPWSWDETLLSGDEARRMQEMVARPVKPGFVQIIQDFPHSFRRHPLAGKVIARTMFETDRLMPASVKFCNQMDYIWVPSEFNLKTFRLSGVAAEKLVVIPGCFDPAPFRTPYEPTALTEELRQSGRFLFLTVYDWTLHKGWDVLLKSFLQAFEGRDDVALVLKVWSTMGYTAESIKEQAREFVLRELGHDIRGDDRIRFVTEKLSRADLINLYKGCDAFVLPSRGEGWGRPLMEAMACGLPTIGTNWSGNTAFMTKENSRLVNYRVVPVPEIGWREIATFQGHCWAEPDGKHLQEMLRRVVEERGEAQAMGARAREEVCARFSREAVGPLLAAEIARVQGQDSPRLALVQSGFDPAPETAEVAEVAADADSAENLPAVALTLQREGAESPSAPTAKHAAKSAGKRRKSEAIAKTTTLPAPVAPLAVCWEGAFFTLHSLALVNREICLGLMGSGKVELCLIPTEPTHFPPEEDPRLPALAQRVFAPLSRAADVHIRHFFPPRLSAPPAGLFVLMQPWEYGYIPKAWIPEILKYVSEIWCYSEYVRQVYLASGIPAEKLFVVPLGVDAETFTPDAPPFVFTTEPGASVLLERKDEEEPFVFLFCGGTLHRKGIDILLEAYLKAFSAYDNVVLVIKDTGVNTVYRGANDREHILSLVGDPTRPAMIYLENDYTAAQMASLYRAAHCLVQPYRGEGFCLPVLEGQSCGRPAIVPKGGPTSDFVDEEVGWPVNAERKLFGGGKIGEWECAGETWMFEVDPRDLARAMRHVFANRAEAKAKGEAGARRVREGWTWKHTCAKVLERLEALRQKAEAQEKAEEQAPKSLKLSIVEGRGKKRVISAEEVPAFVDRRSSSRRQDLTKRRPTITLCMIVRNEERVLGDCLASIKPFVDEIVLVDTGSTDRTVALAEEYGCKVYHFPWCDDFSAARNCSLDKATGDWILWMDADDTIPEECGKRLHQLVLLAETKVTGFIMQVHIPPASGEYGFTIVDHVKLFRNIPEHRFEGRIHEQVLEAIYRAGGVIERSDLYVVHSGYDYTPEGQARKRERDLTILEKDLAERPEHPFVWFNIGMTAFHLKDFDKAISALEQCLAFSKPQESTVRKVYAMLAGAHLEKRDMDGARNRVDQGLALFPNDPELLFRAGIIYRDLGDLAAAEQKYLTLLYHRESGHIDSLDVSMTTYKAHHNLALIYQDMNRLSEAEAQWKAALAYSPQFTPSLLGLGELYLKMGRLPEAEGIVQALMTVHPEHAETLRRHLAQAQGGQM